MGRIGDTRFEWINNDYNKKSEDYYPLDKQYNAYCLGLMLLYEPKNGRRSGTFISLLISRIVGKVSSLSSGAEERRAC